MAHARWEGDTLVLRLKVQPRAGQNGIVGIQDGALKLRLAAAPVDGKANAHLLRWLADSCGVPLRQVSLRQGAGGRLKTVAIQAPRKLPADWQVPPPV